MNAQFDFGFAPRPILRLCYVEQVITERGLIKPVPSRPNLISLIEEGKLEGKLTDYGYVVYEDSFRKWIRDLTTAVR